MGQEAADYAVIFIDKFEQGPVAKLMRDGLRKRFRLSQATLAHLCSGRPVVVKKGLRLDDARRYRAAIQSVGGVCWIQATDADGRLRERRRSERRQLPDRRDTYRGSSIQPDRRAACGRRSSDGVRPPVRFR